MYTSVTTPCLWLLIRVPGQRGWPNPPGQCHMPLSPSPLSPSPAACLPGLWHHSWFKTAPYSPCPCSPIPSHRSSCSAVHHEAEWRFIFSFKKQFTHKLPAEFIACLPCWCCSGIGRGRLNHCGGAALHCWCLRVPVGKVAAPKWQRPLPKSLLLCACDEFSRVCCHWPWSDSWRDV